MNKMRSDVVIMDMEAGIEHLGRGTTGDVDAFIIVVEPGKRSVETAQHVIKLSTELGVKNYHLIVNKALGEDDLAFVERFLDGTNIIGKIPYSEDIMRSGKGDKGICIEDMTQIDSIREKLMKGVMNG